MKKLLVILLALMMCMAFVSCGDDTPATSEGETSESTDTSEARQLLFYK